MVRGDSDNLVAAASIADHSRAGLARPRAKGGQQNELRSRQATAEAAVVRAPLFNQHAIEGLHIGWNRRLAFAQSATSILNVSSRHACGRGLAVKPQLEA